MYIHNPIETILKAVEENPGIKLNEILDKHTIYMLTNYNLYPVLDDDLTHVVDIVFVRRRKASG
jgi:hypothetical protein